MPITPDTKDWTWTLERPCPDCGWDAGAVAFEDTARLIQANVEQWVAYAGAHSDAEIARRPDDATWSPLEYAAHVRDVYRVFHARLNLMLVFDDPTFDNWDQDVTAVALDYAHEEVDPVLESLIKAGTALAAAVGDVPAGARSRTGRRSNGSLFTVTTLPLYCLHDVVHHVWDVTGERFAG
jgi:hypothetical protein